MIISGIDFAALNGVGDESERQTRVRSSLVAQQTCDSVSCAAVSELSLCFLKFSPWQEQLSADLALLVEHATVHHARHCLAQTRQVHRLALASVSSRGRAQQSSVGCKAEGQSHTVVLELGAPRQRVTLAFELRCHRGHKRGHLRDTAANREQRQQRSFVAHTHSSKRYRSSHRRVCRLGVQSDKTSTHCVKLLVRNQRRARIVVRIAPYTKKRLKRCNLVTLLLLRAPTN